MQLAGELSKISLSSMIQLVRNGLLTGEITLQQGAKTATIFVERGRVVHVQSDAGSGKEALFELFLWLTGTFSFIEGKLGDVPTTIPPDEPMDRIIRDGVAYLEQKKYLDQLRINGQTVLKPTPQSVRVYDDPLLPRLDGRRTLAQALADANLSRRDYIQSVHRLLCDGLVLVVDADPPSRADHVDLPGWVSARLKQDNSDLTQAIVDMVIWVDRVKCWMYQADADLSKLVDEFDCQGDSTASGASAASVVPAPEEEAGEQAPEGRPARKPLSGLASITQTTQTQSSATELASEEVLPASPGSDEAAAGGSASPEVPRVSRARKGPEKGGAGKPPVEF